MVLCDLYDLDTRPGQILCTTHTTLGYSSAMNKVLRLIESDMKLENVVQSFLVDLDYDTKKLKCGWSESGHDIAPGGSRICAQALESAQAVSHLHQGEGIEWTSLCVQR